MFSRELDEIVERVSVNSDSEGFTSNDSLLSSGVVGGESSDTLISKESSNGFQSPGFHAVKRFGLEYIKKLLNINMQVCDKQK